MQLMSNVERHHQHRSPQPKMLNRRVAIASLISLPALSPAQSPPAVDRSASNLMVVLRESLGVPARKAESLEFIGKGKAKLPDGKEVEYEMAHYAYIGDMHIRFVFDGPSTMINATPQDLESLHLSKPEAALSVAIGNIRRVYGAPQVTPVARGLFQAEGKSPDLSSSYFLDRDFWNDLSGKYPDGLVAAVPKRGGVVFSPVKDAQAVEVLRTQVAKLHASSERLRVSSALYLFKNGSWSLFQEPSRP
jgi:hypothetical protein